MTDFCVLLQLPNAGDDLQAIKRGVMELADLVVINKADLDPGAATRAQAQITSALRLFGRHGHPAHAVHDGSVWHPAVIQMSALTGDGVGAFWQAAGRFRAIQTANGRLQVRRRHQALAWMWDTINAELKHRFAAHPAVHAALAGTTQGVAAGRLPASTAARRLLALFVGSTAGH